MTYVPTNQTRFEDTAQVSGWGRTSEKGKFSDALKWAVLDLMSLHRCRWIKDKIEKYNPRFLCPYSGCCAINFDPTIHQKVSTNPASSSSSVGRSGDDISSETR
ncbi:unnamed protein product [Allacma fusca]|uniref:Peptidase S1 domain-containing protein n=1 Tax=Allacma fusca TaxID=39272 RepID=A0A8J2K7H4_9HEXA|nr:unnamed protein product [Allacma fusca]